MFVNPLSSTIHRSPIFPQKRASKDRQPFFPSSTLRDNFQRKREGKGSVRNFLSLRRRSFKGESEPRVYTCVFVYRDTCVTIGVIGVATVAPRRGVLLIGTPSRHPSVRTFLPSFLVPVVPARHSRKRLVRFTWFQKNEITYLSRTHASKIWYTSHTRSIVIFRDSSRLFSSGTVTDRF